MLELLQQQRTAIVARGSELRSQEAVLLKAQGLDAEIEKTRTSIADNEVKLAAYKSDLASVATGKREIVKDASAALAEAMGAFLPEGRAVFDVTEGGGVFLGWEFEPGRTVAVGGLSGGQTVVFASALANALLHNSANPVVVMEAAEVGPEIEDYLTHIAQENPRAQVIAATCFPVGDVDGWYVKAV